MRMTRIIIVVILCFTASLCLALTEGQIRELTSEDPQVVLDAKQMLRGEVHRAAGDPVKAHEAAAVLLETAFTKMPADARNYALRLLSFVAGDAEVEALERLLSDEEVRKMALYVLERINTTASQSVIAGRLKTASAERAPALIAALAASEDQRILGPIKMCLYEENEEVRLAAIEALGRVPDRESAEVLRQLMREGAKAEQEAAMTSYLRLAASLEDLDLYRWLYELGAKENVRVAALTGLGTCGGREGMETLFKALESPSAELRGAARQMLIYNTDYSTRLLAQRLRKARPGVQRQLLQVLAQRKDFSAVPAVERLAKSSSDLNVRKAAAELLEGPLKDRSYLPRLRVCAKTVSEGIAVRVKNLDPGKEQGEVSVDLGQLPIGVKAGELKRVSEEEWILPVTVDDPSLLLPLKVKVIIGEQSRDAFLFLGDPNRSIMPKYFEGDGRWIVKMVAGRNVFSTRTDAGSPFIYCEVADDFMYDDDATVELTVDIVTAEGGVHDIVLHYDSSDSEAAVGGRYKKARPTSTEKLSETTSRVTFRLEGAKFAGRQNGSSDLRLAMKRGGEGEIYLTRLAIRRVEQ